MQRSCTAAARPLIGTRGFCTSNSDKIVASVLFERLPVVVPKIDPVVYAFQEFSFRWRRQYQRAYPDEFLKKSDARSLQRALDRRLYLLLYGKTVLAPGGRSVWHFPEKVYKSEETLRKCAESVLKSVIGDLSNTYFVGNAPMGHMVVQPTENAQDLQSCKKWQRLPIGPWKFNCGGLFNSSWNLAASGVIVQDSGGTTTYKHF